jgi:hypothetical protein
VLLNVDIPGTVYGGKGSIAAHVCRRNLNGLVHKLPPTAPQRGEIEADDVYISKDREVGKFKPLVLVKSQLSRAAYPIHEQGSPA